MSGGVVWITGLSASGKTTLGNAVTDALRSEAQNIIFLDGDVLRAVFNDSFLHTREDRLRLAFIYSRLCKTLADQGMIVVIATVALFSEVHLWNRENIENYIEIFIDVPLSELRKRDPKGLYRKYDNGEIKDIAGLDLPVDFPTKPTIHFLFDKGLDVQYMCNEVIQHIKTKKSGDTK
jgi:adenylylsulfate kinase-like enzyme